VSAGILKLCRAKVNGQNVKSNAQAADSQPFARSATFASVRGRLQLFHPSRLRHNAIFAIVVTGEVTTILGMRKLSFRLACALLLLIVSLGARSHVTVDGPADVQAVRAAHLEWTKAWAAKDVNAIVNHYADDADIEMADASIIRGNQAIRSGIKRAFEDPAFALTLVPDRVEVSKAGDYAFVRGTYTKTMSDAATKRLVTTRGEYLVVYRADGNRGWRAIHDISNRGIV
jgi:uncharacterized protein (TIGR02246 family)